MCTFRLKAAQQGFSLYCNDLWGVRHINLSGITPTKRNESGPNSVHVYKSRGDSVCEILGAISPVEAKCGARTNSTQPGFSVLKTRRHFGNFATADIHQIGHRAQRVHPCPLEMYWKRFYKFFSLEVICPRTSTQTGQETVRL